MDSNIIKDRIVKDIFSFAENNLDYLILRNYEGLPEDEGHDIDLLVDTTELHKSDWLINQLKRNYKIRVFKREQYYGLRGYAIVIDNTVLHLDFFTIIQWNRFNFIPTKDALSRKKRFKDSYWVISDYDFDYYCWINYIRAKGNIKEKYAVRAFEWEDLYNKDKIIDIRNGNKDTNKRILIKQFYSTIEWWRPAYNTFRNVCFKIWKLGNMDGRFYVTDDLSNPIIKICRKYCCCNRFDVSDSDNLGFLKALKLIYLEYSIGMSPRKWNTLWWRHFIPSIYVFRNVSDLGETVSNIYRNNEQ